MSPAGAHQNRTRGARSRCGSPQSPSSPAHSFEADDDDGGSPSRGRRAIPVVFRTSVVVVIDRFRTEGGG